MIDIHSHILPGLDDGARSEEESLKMARKAVAEGITEIIATPHHRNGNYDNDRYVIERYVTTLNTLFEEEGIPLKVLPGQETRINGGLVEELRAGELMTLNNSKYLFIEFPPAEVPAYAGQMMYDIQRAGYTPVIVHPERNQELMEHPAKLYEYVKQGALTQVTAASVAGKFGKNIQKFSNQLIDANLTHFVASDAHNVTKRRFWLADAYEDIRQKFGNEQVFLFMENSELLVDNKNINRLEPSRVTRKKFMGLF